MYCRSMPVLFFFNDTATTEIYTLSLHDALPICTACTSSPRRRRWFTKCCCATAASSRFRTRRARSEEHTSELQSRLHLVCRLLLEKKKTDHFQALFSDPLLHLTVQAQDTCCVHH